FRGGPYPHLHRYAHLGGSLGEILLNMVLHPLRTLGFMVSGEKLTYLLALLAPLGLLPLLAPWDLLPALPALAHNLLARDPVMFRYRTQYNSFILPFFILAAVSGYARLAPGLALKGRPLRGLALGLAFLLSLALTSRTVNDLALDRWWLTARQRAAHALVAQVPPGVSVSTPDRFVPHLAMRPKVFVFPVGLEKSEYVLLDARAYPSNVRFERQGNEVALSVGGQGGAMEYRYEVLHEAEGYLVLRRLLLSK
ncbi:MAG: DUF2079 domain-containing protein, partial [Candidatus Rokubacteria bacterium]|nr:DUF2079 domain-containing protein [Candidatus Rokubacteria bacterium]